MAPLGSCTCGRPDEAEDKMVECEKCLRFYHFSCASVNDSIAAEDRHFVCANCLAPTTEYCQSKSSRSSARSARIALDLQQLEEEKRVQDKAAEDKLQREKVYMEKKYNLLHAQLEDQDAERRSRSSHSAIRSQRISEWLQNQPTTTATNTATQIGSESQRIRTNRHLSCSTTIMNTTNNPKTIEAEKQIISPLLLSQERLGLQNMIISPVNTHSFEGTSMQVKEAVHQSQPVRRQDNSSTSAVTQKQCVIPMESKVQTPGYSKEQENHSFHDGVSQPKNCIPDAPATGQQTTGTVNCNVSKQSVGQNAILRQAAQMTSITCEPALTRNVFGLNEESNLQVSTLGLPASVTTDPFATGGGVHDYNTPAAAAA